MSELKAIVYQPGNGTRYNLAYSILDKALAKSFDCRERAMFVAWLGKGGAIFTENDTPGCVAEKLGLEKYMLDADAIAQFVKVTLKGELWALDNWTLCPRCGLPSYKEESYGCYCPGNMGEST